MARTGSVAALTAVVAGVALALSRRRPRLASVLTIVTVWAEISAGVLGSANPRISGVLVYPVLVTAAGFLLGGREAVALAACSVAILALVIGCARAAPHLRLATTTSVDNSGLLDTLVGPFRAETGLNVDVLAVGSGRALQLLRRGDADLAITHDPEAEAAFLREGRVARYRKLMFNDFLVVGPPADPASVRLAPDAVQAMRAIARSGSTFISRGDESGTHARERALWTGAGAVPPRERLLETGQGMAATLRIASEQGAYSLTDRMVVAGPKVIYKGTGTINKKGNYGFLLSAIDGQLPGGGGTDKFRIKIVDKMSGNLVYDNLVGAGDDADPTTEIASGQITITKP